MTPSVWQLLIVILFIGLPVILGLIFIRKKEYSELIENQKYAGFWNRFLAGVIDTIVLIVISLLIYAILFFTINNTETIPIIEEGISPIISFFYFILFQSSSKQGTPGMIVM